MVQIKRLSTDIDWAPIIRKAPSKKKAAQLVFLTVSFSACVPVPYIPLHPEFRGEDLKGIRVGSTTRKEVIAMLGEASVLDEDGYYLTTLDSRSPGFVVVSIDHKKIISIEQLSDVNFIRLLMKFDKNNVLRRFEATGRTFSIAQWPTLTKGVKMHAKNFESSSLAPSQKNTFLDLKYITTLNIGQKGSKVLFSDDGRRLVGISQPHPQCGFDLTHAFVWNIEKILKNGHISPEFTINHAKFIGISPDSNHFAIVKEKTLQIGRLDSFHYQTPLASIPLVRRFPTLNPVCPFNVPDFWQGIKLDFSPNGKTFAFAIKNVIPHEHTVETRLTGGELVSTLKTKDEGGSYSVSDVKYLPNTSNKIATLGCYDPRFGSINCHVKLWDVDTGKEIRSMAVTRNGELSINQNYFKVPKVNMAISPNGNYLATRGFDSQQNGDLLKIWSLPEGNLLAERLLPKDLSNSRHLLFSTDGKLATMMSPGFVLIFNFLQNPDKRFTRLPAKNTNKMALDQIDQVIQLPYSCIPIFDTKKPGIKEMRPRKLFYTANGELGVKCANAGLIVFDIENSTAVKNYSFFDSTPDDDEIVIQIPGSTHPQKINDIEISPDLKRVAVSTDDGFFLLDIPD